MKKPRNLKNVVAQDEPAYIFAGNTFENVAKDSGKVLDEYCIIEKNKNDYSFAATRSFKNIDTNVSARQGFSWDSYEWFRGKESIPKRNKDLAAACQVVYENFGIIHNVIDLMADFATQGIKLVHPNAKIQRMCREWARKIQMEERSERFLNLLYRVGIVAVQRSTAKLKKKDIERLDRAVAINRAKAADMTLIPEVELEKNELPWKYTFINPTCVEVMGDELSSFSTHRVYGLKLSEGVKKKILSPSNDIEREIISKIPQEIINAARSGKSVVPLDPNKTFFYHYKKDDWESFGKPMVAPILKDIIMLEKLKLTDIAACDGAISTVRLWRLGSLDHKIAPTAAAISKLANILLNNTGGGSFDLIWGPELDFKESNSNIHQFLGEEKYKPTLNAIFAGLGIPPTLTGTSTASGFTNNFISLKTLIERLEYGRSIIRMFWQQEILLLQKSLGLKEPPTLHFDRMTLSDEAAEKALLIQLLDRDLISQDTVLERFNELPDIERRRVMTDNKLRQKSKMPEKAGPYHNADALDDFTKLFIQQGVLTPSEVGLELEEKDPNQIPHIEQQKQIQMEVTKMKGPPGQGRPVNKKDSKKRKQRTAKPRSKADFNLFNWSTSAQEKINTIVLPGLLEHYGKANSRQLTNSQTKDVENIKFGILLAMKPYSEINTENIYNILSNNYNVSKSAMMVYNSLVSDFIKKYEREPSLDESRGMQAYTYSIIQGEGNGKD